MNASSKRDEAVDVFNALLLCSDQKEKAQKLKELTELLVRVPKNRELLPEFVPRLCELQLDQGAAVRRELAALLESLGGLPATTLSSAENAPYLVDALRCLASLSGDESEKVGKRALMAANALLSSAYKACVREHSAVQLERCWPALEDLRQEAAKTLRADSTAKGGHKVYACKFLESLVVFLSSEDLERLASRSDPVLYAKLKSGALEAGNKVFDEATALQDREKSSGVPATVAMVLLSALGAFARCRPELYAQGACGLLGNVAEALGRGKDGSAEGGDGGQAEAKRNALAQTLKQVLLGLVRSDKVRSFGGEVVETCAGALQSLGFDADASQARGKRPGPAARGAGQDRPKKRRRGPEDALPAGELLARFQDLVAKTRRVLAENDLQDFEGPVLSAEATADAVLANFGLDPAQFAALAAADREGEEEEEQASYRARSAAEALMDAQVGATQHAAQLSREDLKFMALASMRRLQGANLEAGATAASASPEDHQASLQDRLLGRIAAMALGNFWGEDRPHCKKVLDSLLEHILERMQRDGGHATAMGLFYAVFALGKGFRAVYDQMLMQLLRGMRRALPPHDRAMCRLLLELPTLPQGEIVAFLRDLIIMSSDKEGDEEAVEWAALGLAALRDLVFERPSLRRSCLTLSLSCAMHNNESLRQKATELVADTLYPSRYLQGDIENFALKALRQLTAKGDGVSQTEVSRHMGLLFALCVKKHDLLHELLSTFARASSAQRKVMNQKVAALAKEIPASSPAVLSVVEGPPRGSEILLLLVLHSMAEKGPLPPRLVRAVQSLHRKTGDARFLVPIFADMPKADAIDCLPKFAELPETARKTAILNAFAEDPQGRTEGSITASELFVRLHLIDEQKTGVSLKKLIECTNLCFQLKEIYNSTVLSVSIQQLVQVSPSPPTTNLQFR